MLTSTETYLEDEKYLIFQKVMQLSTNLFDYIDTR